MMHTPLFLQGVPPSQLESLKLHVQEERNCYVVQAHMPGVRQEGGVGCGRAGKTRVGRAGGRGVDRSGSIPWDWSIDASI